MATQCQYSRNGKQCRAYSILGSNHCFWHNPNMKIKRDEARKKGGLNRRKPTRNQELLNDINKSQDILDVLLHALNDVLVLENSLDRARTIDRLCKNIFKVLQYVKSEKQTEEFVKKYNHILTMY